MIYLALQVQQGASSEKAPADPAKRAWAILRCEAAPSKARKKTFEHVVALDKVLEKK